MFRFGPIRGTLSKRGVGWSVALLPFLRVGIGPHGGKYVSVSIPGTGISFIKYLGSASGGTQTNEPKPIASNPAPEQLEPHPNHLTKNQEILEDIRLKQIEGNKSI